MKGRWIALALSITSASAAAQQASPMISKAKSILVDRAIDPASIQFRKVRIVRDTIGGKPLTMVCGEYNAKNRLGGYNGFKTFAYETSVLKGTIITRGPDGIDWIEPNDGPGAPMDVLVAITEPMILKCSG